MEVLKTRKIKLLRPFSNERNKVSRFLTELSGIKDVEFIQDKNLLIITYDLEKIMLKTIEELLEAQGVQLKESYWEKIKRGWYHYAEQNELDNLHLHPTCCSDPKATLAKAKHS